MSRERKEGDWPVSWKAHDKDQTVRIARETTPAQRLAWLEEVLEFAYQLGALQPEPPSREVPSEGDPSRE